VYETDIRAVSPTWTAVVRAAVPINELSQFVPAACGEVWDFIRAAGIPGPGCHVALYRPDGVVEVGVEVAGPFSGSERVQCGQLPTGRAAHTLHLGSYGGLPRAHAALRQWCVAEGHVITGTSLERYGHWQEAWNADPSKIQTDVYYLLEPTTA
jgi:effector-binding domain-containing protein